MIANAMVPADPTERRRLCVLTIVDRLMTSGGEIIATRIAEALDPYRFESIICSTRPSDPVHVSRLEAAGIGVVLLDRRSRLDLYRWKRLVDLLRTGRVDILHSHKFGSNAWSAVLARLFGVPVFVAHEHSWSYEGQPLRRLIDRGLIAGSADVFLATSAFDRRRMIEIEGVRETNVRFLTNGVPALPSRDGDAARRRLGIAPDAPVIGTVCGLRPPKALEVLVEAAALLVPRFPGLKVLIVGDGTERDRLQAQVAALDLGGCVTFLGQRTHDEIADIVATFDVGVSSSDSEGTPLAVIEMMSAGRPIVATAVGGLPAVVADGVEGLLVPPRDPAALAAAVSNLLADDDRRARLGARARERHERDFDFALMVERLERLYEALYWSSAAARRGEAARDPEPAG